MRDALLLFFLGVEGRLHVRQDVRIGEEIFAHDLFDLGAVHLRIGLRHHRRPRGILGIRPRLAGHQPEAKHGDRRDEGGRSE
jgi:hypothetical protein